jgi:hypothetical protein
LTTDRTAGWSSPRTPAVVAPMPGCSWSSSTNWPKILTCLKPLTAVHGNVTGYAAPSQASSSPLGDIRIATGGSSLAANHRCRSLSSLSASSVLATSGTIAAINNNENGHIPAPWNATSAYTASTMPRAPITRVTQAPRRCTLLTTALRCRTAA